ncbi:hypothetical protein [Mesorhizobium sp. L2C067A000]|uniref:hypothetical protein n=1 Tax=Mesorhizobium sp. L2C067A000 TaxID=1287106 RepID=UPI0012DFE909|nr:hypothetical protein [Mesorhizobium sp. L2C067A000]
MGASEFRYASLHPALRFAGAMHGFDRAEFFREVSKVYAPLSNAQEDELFALVGHFLFQAAQYQLAVKSGDLAKFTADIGLRIDGLLNDLAAPMLGFEYENFGEDEGDLVARFKHRKEKPLHSAKFDEDRERNSRFNRSRPLLDHLGGLFSFVHEGKPFPLNRLSMSPEILLGELSKLRNYLVFLTTVYSAKTEVKFPGILESQRSALHRLIEKTHEWAGRERLPRAAKATAKAHTEFALLIDLILREVDDWLVEFSKSDDLMSDAEESSKGRLRGQIIDMPNNLDALVKVIEKCITAANKRKRQKPEPAPLP